MLKTILFLSIIIKLALGDIDIGENEIEMSMDLFQALEAVEIDDSDELTDIEAEVQRRCKLINTKRKCLQATSPIYPGGLLLDRKPNMGNDNPGECVYIPDADNQIARKLGNQCVSPASVRKLIRRIRRRANNPPTEDVEEDIVIAGELDDFIDSEDDTAGLPTVELTMNVFDDLSQYIDTYTDEISAEMMKTCKEVKTRKACMNAVSVRSPDGVDSGRRGNNGKGQCMWFQLRSNKYAKAFGNRCIPPAFIKNHPPFTVQADDEIDGEDIDAVEMSEDLFDSIAQNAPVPSDEDVSEDMMKYCKEIVKEGVCLRSTSAAPVGKVTNRRGNDGPGECMWFQRKNNQIVQALGNQCLPPLSVLKYKGIIPEEEEEDDAVNTVEISMDTWDELALYITEDNDIFADARMIVNCKQIKKEKLCLQRGVTPLGANGIGIDTGRRGNDSPGECMWFNKRNNKIVQALGSRCLAPAAVKQYKNPTRHTDVTDDDEPDSILMDEGLFNQLSANTPVNDEDITADMVKTCKQIKGRKVCLNSYSQAPIGIVTGRRGNDGPGECMYFARKRNDVVQALGNQCLPALSVVKYKQSMKNNPPFDVEEDDEDSTDGLPTVELTMDVFEDLSQYIDTYDDEISAEMMKTCKGIKKAKACMNAVSVRSPDGVDSGRRGNDGKGECMWFQLRSNKYAKAFGNRCIPPAFIKNHPPFTVQQDDGMDEDEIDSVEMSEGLFDSIAQNAPTTEEDDILEDIMKYCKQINKEKACLNAESRAPNGRTTGRRGNDGDGECMWFKRNKSPVVRALGNRCLAPQAVINYKNRPFTMEHEFFAALGLIDEESDSLNYSVLSMVFVMMVLIGYGAYYKLFRNNNDKQESLLRPTKRRPSRYQSV